MSIATQSGPAMTPAADDPARSLQSLATRQSIVELGARERAAALLDPGSLRELVDPFERERSPWLAAQGVVTQADDGVVVAKGTIDGQPAVVLAIEGAFQGGSMGEVGGAKIAGALELAAEDNRQGRDPRGHRRPAAICPGGGRDCRQRRLLRWHVDRRRPV